MTPHGAMPPIDPHTGAMSVGVPVFNTDVTRRHRRGPRRRAARDRRVRDRRAADHPGYWQKPEETAKSLRDGELRTGDVGFMDEQGWFYLVDRSKDMIVASGFKVWPREVEEVLYLHPAVREAAVIGIPDPYRGETIKAVISLKPGQHGDAPTRSRRSRASAWPPTSTRASSRSSTSCRRRRAARSCAACCSRRRTRARCRCRPSSSTCRIRSCAPRSKRARCSKSAPRGCA